MLKFLEGDKPTAEQPIIEKRVLPGLKLNNAYRTNKFK